MCLIVNCAATLRVNVRDLKNNFESIGPKMLRMSFQRAGAYAVALFFFQIAHAQGLVEQYPAELPLGLPGKTILALADPASPGNDATPLGVNLQHVEIVAPGVAVRPRQGDQESAVDTSRAGLAAGDMRLRSVIDPFIGKPISRQALSQLQRQIIGYYRARKLPLVSVTFPPQEITDGSVRLHVVNYRLGQKTVTGNSHAGESYLLSRIRAKPGDEIDMQRLSSDLDWLRLNPYRHLRGHLSPGRAFGTTDLEIEILEGRPWSAYIEANNFGQKRGYVERLAFGFHTAALPWPDHQFAYRLTVAPKSLRHGVVSTGGRKGYVSNALSYFAPLALGDRRVKLRLAASHTESTNTDNGPFRFNTKQSDVSLELAVPVYEENDIAGFQQWDVFGTVATSRHSIETLFGGVRGSLVRTTIPYLGLGLRGQGGTDAQKGWETEIKLYIGRQDGANTKSFVVLRAASERVFRLLSGADVIVSGHGQLSNIRDIHTVMQFAAGGTEDLHGYEFGEIAGHSGIAALVELRSAAIDFPVYGETRGNVFGYGFVDAGFAAGAAGQRDQHPVSVGFGIRGAIGTTQLHVGLSRTLGNAGRTEKGDTHVNLALRHNF